MDRHLSARTSSDRMPSGRFAQKASRSFAGISRQSGRLSLRFTVALVTGPRICQTNCQRDNDLGCPPSRPTRGAWIETLSIPSVLRVYPCRAPHWARGLKQRNKVTHADLGGVAPLAGRVLKQLSTSDLRFSRWNGSENLA